MAEPLITNMEFTRLRGVSRSPQGAPLLQLMDAVDEGNILLLIKVQAGPQIVAMDIYGSEQFTVSELGNGVSSVTRVGKPAVGKIVKKTEVGRTFLEPFTDTAQDNMILNFEFQSQSHFSAKFVDVTDTVLGTVKSYEPCKSVVDVFTQRSLDVKPKMLILAMAVRITLSMNKRHRMWLPSVRITPSAPPPQALPTGSLHASLFDNVYVLSSSMIRAAGYNEAFCRQYYDVINTSTDVVDLTMEVNNIGEVFAYTGLQELVFKTTTVLYADYYDILDPDGSVIFRFANDRFKNSKDRDLGLYVVETYKVTNQGHPIVLDMYDCDFSPIINITACDGNVTVKIDGVIRQDISKKMVLSYAMRASLATYGLHKLPMPHIQYFYANDQCDKPFLF